MATSDILVLLIGAVIVLLAVGVLRYTTSMLKAVVETASKSSDSSGLYVGLTATMIALFGILISGIFLFMTLQINNTAQQAAASAATSAATEQAGAIAREITPDIAHAAAVQEARSVLSTLVEEKLKELGIARDVQDGPTLLEIDQPLDVPLRIDELVRFELNLEPEWSRYQIDAVGGTDDTNGQFDTVLTLYDGTDIFLAYSDDIDDDNLDSRIVFDADVGESYYVELHEYGGDAGEATLRLTAIR